MKRKIILGLGTFSLLILLCGIFIIWSIEKATGELDTLITLHQVEILRESLLIQIKRVQSDLHLKNTRYSKGMDKVVRDVMDMRDQADRCQNCHHNAVVTDRIEAIKNHIQEYEHALSRVFTLRANSERIYKEEDNAFHVGEELITKVNNMIAFTSHRLESRTHDSLRTIRNMRTLLFILVGLGPLVSIALSVAFIRGITRPISVLLNATRKIRDGDLDHKITGLRDEFGEVAESFNVMAEALTEQLALSRQDEERYRAVVDQSADCIFLAEVETLKVMEANPAMEKLLGYRRDELLEMTLHDFVDHDTGDIEEKANMLVKGKHPFIGERKYCRKDGGIVHVEVSANVITFGNRRLLSILARDITERKRAQDALYESEQRYRALFESAGDAIFILDAEGETAGRIVSANPAAARMHGYSVEELLTMNIADLDAPQDAKEVTRRIKALLEGKWINTEMVHVRHDGSQFPVEVSAGLLELGGRKYILVFDRDISERKMNEQALKRAEHLKVVGELAAGLVHEIKNPLTGIKAAMEVFSEELDVSDEDRAVLSKIISEIKRMELLMKSLLNFAKPPEPHFMTVDLNYILDRTLALSLEYPSFRKESAKAISIVKDFDVNVEPSLADPLQLQQVFLNLFLNAADSMPQGGVLNVRTEFDLYSQSIKVEIADTGIGIREDLLSKVFDPFFTTKSKGSGLGLAITKRIVEQHGGKISVLKPASSGTVFQIVLPYIHTKEGQPQWQAGEEYLL